MDVSKIVAGAKIVASAANEMGITKTLLGTYADGTTRSLPDAIQGEIYSPKQKGKAIKDGKKKTKRKKYKIDKIL